MVRMNICGLLWLSGWKGWVRNAWCIAWGRTLLDDAKRVNPLVSPGWLP